MSDWPQDLNASRRVLGNFRPDRFAKNAGPAPWAKRREILEGNSNAHLALIRMLPCSVCEVAKGVHAHHLRSLQAAKERGVGRKASDRWAVSLCRAHHEDIHRYGSRREPEWFMDGFEINPHALANALWNNTGDISRLSRVLLAHKLEASRALIGRRRK